jgi:hypothetical protein
LEDVVGNRHEAVVELLSNKRAEIKIKDRQSECIRH